MGVVVRRYIDFLILLIPTPRSFLQQHPYFLFIFKNVFYIIIYIHNYVCNQNGQVFGSVCVCVCVCAGPFNYNSPLHLEWRRDTNRSNRERK